MDFSLPQELADYLAELDRFIETTIKPIERRDDNIRYFDHRREHARTDWENNGLPRPELKEVLVGCAANDIRVVMIWNPQILDLYEDVDDIRSCGQTIVYTIHDTIGHLGIFVSGAVAKKEHGEFANNIDLIDTLPPGLYEAVFEPKTDSTPGTDLVTGDWLMRCEMRTFDDIRALGSNDAADERRFATAARISEVNLALYRTFAQPTVRALESAPVVETLQHMQPLKVQYENFSNANPFMAPVAAMAEEVRKNRKPVASAEQFAGDVHANPAGKDILLLVWSKGNASYRVVHPSNGVQNGM